MSSGVLMPSLKSSGDAYYGDGVYFTSLPQTTGYAKLHENNVDGSRKYKGQEAYVVVDRAKVPNLRDASHFNEQGRSHRDIFVALGTEPLDLSKVGGRLSWKKGSTEYCF